MTTEVSISITSSLGYHGSADHIDANETVTVDFNVAIQGDAVKIGYKGFHVENYDMNIFSVSYEGTWPPWATFQANETKATPVQLECKVNDSSNLPMNLQLQSLLQTEALNAGEGTVHTGTSAAKTFTVRSG